MALVLFSISLSFQEHSHRRECVLLMIIIINVINKIYNIKSGFGQDGEDSFLTLSPDKCDYKSPGHNSTDKCKKTKVK